MRDYKVDTVRGIKVWQWRMNQLNDDIMLLPCNALENRGVLKQAFLELDMRKILNMALPNSYQKKLVGIDWNIHEANYFKTIDKLQHFEPEIKAEAAKAKSNKELANKVYGNKGTKRGHNGSIKVTDVEKTACKTCGKQHKGKCWLKKGGNAGRNGANCHSTSFDQKQKNYIK